eukprot:8928900-Pyramimonas_sp.AAC.1
MTTIFAAVTAAREAGADAVTSCPPWHLGRFQTVWGADDGGVEGGGGEVENETIYMRRFPPPTSDAPNA